MNGAMPIRIPMRGWKRWKKRLTAWKRTKKLNAKNAKTQRKKRFNAERKIQRTNTKIWCMVGAHGNAPEFGAGDFPMSEGERKIRILIYTEGEAITRLITHIRSQLDMLIVGICRDLNQLQNI